MVAPPTVSRATPWPEATAPLVVTLTDAGMSNPLTAVKSRGFPLSVTGTVIVWVPLFGGNWIDRVSAVESRTYWEVTPPVSDWPKLFV